MIAFFIQNKDPFSDKIRYTWKMLTKMIGVEWHEIQWLNEDIQADAIVMYGKKIPDGAKADVPIILLGQNGDISKARAREHVQKIKSMQHRDPQDLVSLYNVPLPPLQKPLYCDADSNAVLISRSSTRAHIGVDLLATCFYFLSLENENQIPQRDQFYRFQRNFSPLGEDIYEQPVVDRFAAFLKSLLQEMVGDRILKPVWPHNADFAVALSHDVDRIRTWTFHKARRALRRSHSNKNAAARTLGLMRSVTFPENWLGNFNFITRLEQKYDAGSTFFFVSRHRHKLDPTYMLSSWRLKHGLRLIKERGGSIGLHGTIPSASGGGLLGVERNALFKAADTEITGGRQHYLCFQRQTPALWQEAGLKYDSTLGFSYHTGYRCGTSFPFYLHDGASEMPILELPLILMDTVLFLESKQHLSAGQAWQVIEHHLQETRRNNALLTINWHNSDLHPFDVYGYSQLYLRILQWARENNGWLAATNEVYEWWVRK